MCSLRADQVYREHFRFVWRMVQRWGVKDVDDAVHDVFLVVLRRLPEFDMQTPIRSWLFGIVRRVAADHHRRRLRARRRLDLQIPARSPPHQSSDASPCQPKNGGTQTLLPTSKPEKDIPESAPHWNAP